MRLEHHAVAPHLHEFLSAHPHVAIELDVTERAEEIARPGCDVALVLGPFATSSMVARRLGMIERRVVAAPSLARRVGKLSSPRALEEVPCVVFRGSGPTWTFRRGGAVEFVRPRARFISTSVEAVRIVALAGVGVALLPHWLIAVDLETGAVDQLPTDPMYDFLNPVFMPGDKILFTTSKSVEEGAPQHRDEYERGVTLQVGSMNRDGTGLVLGPRNLSHRVFPTLTSDGRILLTQWDHLGNMNAGHLMFMNPDMTTLREAFGKESTGVTNSYLKAREVSPGRFVAIGTSRDRTVQSGAILDGHPVSYTHLTLPTSDLV